MKKKNLKFKFKRLEKDLTQAELREKSKTSIQTIVDIERGKSIDGLRVGTLKKLAKNTRHNSTRFIFFR